MPAHCRSRRVSPLARPWPALLATVLACSHSQPFAPQDQSSREPLAPGVPARLTYNPGKDLRPAWLADGSGFWYATEPLNGAARGEADRCLVLMGPEGGTILRRVCNTDPAARDSLDAFDLPVPSPDGRVVFTRASSRVGDIAPRRAGLMIGSVDRPEAARQLLPLPYTVPGGRMHGGMSHLRWLSADRLVYLGEQVAYPRPCPSCAPDTLITGLEIVELTGLDAVRPLQQVVPGTFDATSVALGPEAETVYYTVLADSRVFARRLGTGAVSVLHDFGTGRIARDVQVTAGRLLAVVDGQVTPFNDPILGAGQRDAGGNLRWVDLDTGVESAVASPARVFFRRPALAPGPGARRVVAEGYAFTVSPPPGLPDTVVSRLGDLWLLELP